MTRFIDLTAVEVVENQLKKQLEPVVATQEMVKSILDLQQPMMKMVAESLASFAEAAQIAQKAILPHLEVIDTFSRMQELVEQTKISFDLPAMLPIPPLEFGEMCVEVMEDEDEMIPLFVPDRRVTAEDRRLIAEEVVQILKEENLIIAAKQQKTKLLGSPSIQKIAIVRPETKTRYHLIVNDNYQNPIQAGKAKCWEYFLRIAEGERFLIEQVKGVFDYLNTNKECLLYSRTDYALQKVLEIQSGVVVPAISIEVISEKAFATRRNKST